MSRRTRRKRLKKYRPLWHPALWPSWVAVGLARLLAFLPWRAVVVLGPWVGRAYGRLNRRRRAIARINIELCFPERSPEWRRRLLRAQFENLGIAFLEAPYAWWSPRWRRADPDHGFCRIHGLEHLDAALARGKGVLLLSAHFNSPELGGRLLALHRPFVALYRPSNNPVFDRMIRRARAQKLEQVPRDDVRGLLRALKAGKAVWYAVDQNTARRESIFVDFFGIPASTNSATARLARLTGAAVVPFLALRRADGSGYDLHLEPAWDDYPGDDLAADTRRVNALVERWVRAAPEQYLWIHRRFRTRPNRSDPPIYPRR